MHSVQDCIMYTRYGLLVTFGVVMLCFFCFVSCVDVYFFFFFFFFQAEDGIRDLTVTGVQTCALPIWKTRIERNRRFELFDRLGQESGFAISAADEHAQRRTIAETLDHRSVQLLRRSEERRVGKECRSRWWAEH